MVRLPATCRFQGTEVEVKREPESGIVSTNAVRVLLERRSPQLDQWFAEDRCSVSAIVAAEISFCLERRRLPERRAVLVQNLLEVLPIEAFDEPVSHVYGALRFRLQQIGITVAAMDLLIASHALALERTLISDEQVFAQVPGLHLVQAS